MESLLKNIKKAEKYLPDPNKYPYSQYKVIDPVEYYEVRFSKCKVHIPLDDLGITLYHPESIYDKIDEPIYMWIPDLYLDRLDEYLKQR